MLDFEIIVVKAGIIILASLAVIRMVLHDVNNLKRDFRRRVPPRKRAKRTRS
jgi:hypothetical protein